MLRTLPVLGRYCYGHKVLYFDKDTWVSPFEVYDADSKLWKIITGAITQVTDNNGDGDIASAINHFGFLDLQNSHATVVVTAAAPRLDNDAPADIQDAAVAAFPGNLMHIMK